MRSCKYENKELHKFEKRAVFLRVLRNDRKWGEVEEWKTPHRKDGIYLFRKIIPFEEESLSESPDKFWVLQMSEQTGPKRANSNWDGTKRRFCSFVNMRITR